MQRPTSFKTCLLNTFVIRSGRNKLLTRRVDGEKTAMQSPGYSKYSYYFTNKLARPFSFLQVQSKRANSVCGALTTAGVRGRDATADDSPRRLKINKPQTLVSCDRNLWELNLLNMILGMETIGLLRLLFDYCSKV